MAFGVVNPIPTLPLEDTKNGTDEPLYIANEDVPTPTLAVTLPVEILFRFNPITPDAGTLLAQLEVIGYVDPVVKVVPLAGAQLADSAQLDVPASQPLALGRKDALSELLAQLALEANKLWVANRLCVANCD